MLEPMSVTMSLIHNKKSRGSKMEPCGMPARMRAQSEEVLERTTLGFLSKRQFLNQAMATPVTSAA